MEWLIIVLLVLAVFGGLGYWISTQKQRNPVEGAVLGAFFGPLGALIEAVLPSGNYQPPAPQPKQPQTPEEMAAQEKAHDAQSKRLSKLITLFWVIVGIAVLAVLVLAAILQP
jgi:hypothetical protein